MIGIVCESKDVSIMVHTAKAFIMWC